MARKLRPVPREGILAVYAVINGPRTWRSLKLAIDTGATYTMLPPDVLIDIGYHPAAAARSLELSTANGLVVAPLLQLRSLKCLGRSVKGLDVVAHHLPSESPVEGLLGLNFLTHFPPFQIFVRSLKPFRL